MSRTAEQAAEIIAADHPEVVDCLRTLGAAGIRYAIVGSQAAHLASLMLDIPDLAPPDDWDLQIVPRHFEAAVECTGANVRWNTRFNQPTGDGKRMRFVADDARVPLGDTTIQFMRVHGLVRIGLHRFDTSFSDEAYQASWQCGPFRFAHDTETLTLYGLRQGGRAIGKQDLARAAAVRAVRPPATEPYANFRAGQVKWNGRLQ
jgi:hypothetical protein